MADDKRDIEIVEALPSYVLKADQPRHVLIIEDSPDSAHTLTLLLRDMGHVADYAINGYVGLEMARRLRPEFVFIDIGLPGMDGYEVCRRLKADPLLKDARIAVITAYAEDEYRKKSEAAGCHVHLVKPVPLAILEELLA